MANQVSSIDVPLSIFGSLNLELSPPDLPEGASPANNDVVYLPGSVQTRPGVNRLFATPLSSLGPTSYEKSFVAPDGTVKNLYLTQGDGILWVENVTSSPGMVTQLFQTAGAKYASSCTAFGREYIALSDGKHGADMPIQYDGTNLYRFTQDGPAIAPMVTSLALAPSTLAASGAPATTAITSITTTDPVTVGVPPHQFTVYGTLTLIVASTAGFSIAEPVSIAGATGLNVSSIVFEIINATTLKIGVGNPTFAVETGGTLTGTPNTTLVRANNTVFASTATDHNLQVGYQALIQGAGTANIGGGINSIVLNNEEMPGLATVTTAAPHGLLPGNSINISGVNGVAIGAGITNVAFAGNLVTITTSTAHGLSIGSEVIVTAVTNTTVNGQWVVASIPSASTFTYAFVSIVTAYSAADTGTVEYLWPLANVNPAQNFFTVVTAPSPVTFTIALNYTDGTWISGSITFAWDGLFYVTAVTSTTEFQYQQRGPDASTTAAGTVTPYGRVAPGLHQVRVSYLFATGAISAPSPAAQWVANGGQYAFVSNIPIGPSNVVGKVYQFTGSGGAYFFYIPVPAQVNGLTVSTATQINDNTTTSAILDFSDNTLYAATAVSIPGNDLAAQVTLGPCAGIFAYSSRLMAWGERNKIQNFLNMGFDADTVAVYPPQGWTISGLINAGVTDSLASRPPGGQWLTSTSFAQTISQSAYLDSYGAPILQGNTTYRIRLWLKPSYKGGGGPDFIATFTSASASFTSTATIPNASMSLAGSFLEATFSAATPNAIPSDMLLNLDHSLTVDPSYVMRMDEVEIIPISQPYTDTISRISYVDNPEAFDAITGILGAVDDSSPIMNFGTIRNALYLVTGTGLHETEDNGQTEPSNWTVDQVSDNCGAFSIAAVGRNAQGIGSAGKDWMMWNGPDGAQIFTGQKPWKVSQEIQSYWDTMPAASAYQCWVKNFESSKRCYFGIPVGGSMQILVLDYRNIDGTAIAENPPVHISFTGKMIVSDLTRKWTVWTLPAFCGELLYRNTSAPPQIAFGCKTPANGGNSYVLNPAQFHDDDFGVIPASYTTYFFVSHEQEQALQVGSHRHVYTMAAAYITGTGNWTLTPYAASLSNPFPTSLPYPLSIDPPFDMDFGINVESSRCAYKVSASPIAPSLDSFFKLEKLIVNMAPSPWAKVRGSSGGSF